MFELRNSFLSFLYLIYELFQWNIFWHKCFLKFSFWLFNQKLAPKTRSAEEFPFIFFLLSRQFSNSFSNNSHCIWAFTWADSIRFPWRYSTPRTGCWADSWGRWIWLIQKIKRHVVQRWSGFDSDTIIVVLGIPTSTQTSSLQAQKYRPD